jgi:small-conductance mechanosensitive channel
VTAAALLTPALVTAGLTALAIGARALLLKQLGAQAERHPSDASRALYDALRLPSLLWALVLGLYGGAEVATLPSRLTSRLLLLLHVLIIASVTATAANLVAALIARFGERRTLSVGVTGLARTAVQALVWTVGTLIVLDDLGVAITPILTALGVGGLAVALALQDTLSNLFAGLHLLADRPIRVGDYVRIDGGIEGFVDDIGWRSTRIRQLANNMAIVPNATLAKGAITNYFLPEPRMSVSVRVNVSYATDPDRVERVLVEEAVQAAADVPGLLKDPPPSVRFIPGFGESALQFTLDCSVATYADQYLAQHELRKRIIRRFRTEGIEIPFPVRTVELRSPEGPGPRS